MADAIRPLVGRHATPVASALNAPNLLIAWLTALFLIPARLVVPGLGAAGRPAVILGLAMLLWWILTQLHPALKPPGRQPLLVLAVPMILSVAVSYVIGLDRGLSELELNSSHRFILVLGSLLGVALLAADGLRSRAEVERVISAVILLTSISGVVGILQFTGTDLAPYFRLPGLVYNQGLVGTVERGGPGFSRVYGLQQHYIEFAVVLAMTVPLALHRALTSCNRRLLVWRLLVVALIVSAIPLAVSRAGVLGLTAAGVTLALVWPRKTQIWAVSVGLVGLTLFQAAVPGLLGTIRSAFTSFNEDPSITHRLEDYAATAATILDRPWLGRGSGTYIPELYRILDNQFLTTLLEQGVVGATALVGLLLGAYGLARQVRRRAPEQRTAHLGQALAASVVCAGITSFTFDSLSFPTFAGLLFLLIGCIAACWRASVQSRLAGEVTPDPEWDPGLAIISRPKRFSTGD